MLANPDIAPSASINRWIVSILTFHFTLVHVAGTHHGPDGLSRRPPQEGDEEPDTEEEFRDWIDKLHSFVHQLDPITSHPFPSDQVKPTFALASDPSKGEDPSYKDVPRTANAIRDDAHLLRVRKWLEDLV